MSRTTHYLTILFMAFGLSSCAQGTSEQKLRKTAAVFAADKVPTDLSKYSQATFAAGCFWHEETLFESIIGVMDAVSGYAGGHTRNPTYNEVSTGETGHAETVNIYYDSSKISYPTLLKIYFEAQEDPTQVDGQGNDNGTEYRSIIFYRNVREKQMAEEFIAKLNKSGKYRKPISAQVMPFTTFWKAEDYHQHYICHNLDNPYVHNVSIRDIVNFQKQNPDMIKPGHSFVAN